ncbi:DUF4350 domain-containing protein [Actinoplanes friuliensis]|uniref:DUF4350 domain-containing protein n=1 Tax=Actinoplanes friuliensis DSM 7358 TaxID=1246995 RepID=U5VT58_9ACTN|nr:DUF4350 domain-containing protein [Actinoplanes friuliensis]AGZ39997.1 hypothetical protein AFR_08540 [Actinoplanes friuliensis DSM 7358]
MKSRRWMRFALPFVVVAGLATLTGIVHAVEQSDPTDASFLSPTSDEGEGARRLADSLARDGVDIDVRSSTADALTAAGAGGPATVFVTTPGLVNPSYLDQFQSLPPEVRVVLVAPGAEQVRRAGLTIPVGGPRWTAAAPQPGCSTDYATAAGPAAALRLAYDPGGYRAVRCYQDGLVEIQTPRARMTLIGASDPFRNDRADEHGNHTLAVGLLGRAPRVIWLDLHERESDPAPTATPPPAPTRDDQSGTDESEPREGEEDEAGEPTDGPSGEPEDGQAAENGGGNAVTGSPLAQAFPPAVWATLALLALAALALAAASARRLGAPVAEPLPVRVRAAETVRGLGGLYRRAGARSTSLATVQNAARLRLTEHFGMPPDSPVDEVAERVAAVTRQPVAEVRHVLGAGVEDSDEELARAATTVQNLVRYVTGQQNWQQGPDEGKVT